jgi:hypothetical protein
MMEARMNMWFVLALVLALLLSLSPAEGSVLVIHWNEVDDSEEVPVTGYKVYRRAENDSSWTLVGSPTQPSFVDATGNVNERYCYHVRAFNEAGESPPSAEACGTVTDVTVRVPEGKQVLPSRRSGQSSIVAVLSNQGDEVTVHTREQLAHSKRADGSISIVPLLVDQNETVKVNGTVVP